MQFSRKDAGWVGSYRYDFGLPKYRHVIEIHGIQHYQNLNCFASKKRGRTLAEEMQNDKNKQELAIKNNFSYLSIDSRESTKKWMKNSIIQSGILEVLKVSIEDIDWDECNTFALSNLCKTICDYKNKNPKSTAREIAKIFHISGTTVASYLHIGNEIGLCHYNGLYKRIKMSKNNESVGIFNSASDIVKDKRFFDFSIACIGAVCRGKRKTYNGYNFEYI